MAHTQVKLPRARLPGGPRFCLVRLSLEVGTCDRRWAPSRWAPSQQIRKLGRRRHRPALSALGALPQASDGRAARLNTGAAGCALQRGCVSGRRRRGFPPAGAHRAARVGPGVDDFHRRRPMPGPRPVRCVPVRHVVHGLRQLRLRVDEPRQDLAPVYSRCVSNRAACTEGPSPRTHHSECKSTIMPMLRTASPVATPRAKLKRWLSPAHS